MEAMEMAMAMAMISLPCSLCVSVEPIPKDASLLKSCPLLREHKLCYSGVEHRLTSHSSV